MQHPLRNEDVGALGRLEHLEAVIGLFDFEPDAAIENGPPGGGVGIEPALLPRSRRLLNEERARVFVVDHQLAPAWLALRAWP